MASYSKQQKFSTGDIRQYSTLLQTAGQLQLVTRRCAHVNYTAAVEDGDEDSTGATESPLTCGSAVPLTVDV